MIEDLWRNLRSLFCAHEFSVSKLKRMPNDRVYCQCEKCGAVKSAPCGLMLPGKLVS